MILGSSIISAASADNPGQVGLVEIYVCVTALVFYLAHVYARVIGAWIEGEPPSAGGSAGAPSRVVDAQRSAATRLVLTPWGAGADLGPSRDHDRLDRGAHELMVGVVYACFKVRASQVQAVASVSAAAVFAVVVFLLKAFVHH